MEVIIPESIEHWLKLRSKDVTSTSVSALHGLNPYTSKFELYQRLKNNVIVEFKETKRTKIGKLVEEFVAQYVRDDNGWVITKADEYIRDPELGMGSSFDYWIGDDGILEIKNVDSLQFKEKWIVGDDKEIEAPPHIEMQVQFQLALSERKYCYIAAYIGGNDVRLIYREPDEQVIGQIKTSVAAFWSTLKTGTPPELDAVKDLEVLKLIYSYAETGKVKDVREDAEIEKLARQYTDLGKNIKQLEGDRLETKFKILSMIDDAAKAKGEDFTISAGARAACRVEAFDKKAGRDFRINWRKKK